MKRARGCESAMSFFSFQDIIACVTGIMILVTLILALNPLGNKIASVTTPGSASTPQVVDEATVARVNEARERQQAAKEAVARLNKEIEERRARPEISEAQVLRIEQQAEADAQLLENMQARVEAARARVERAKTADTAAQAELKQLDQREVDARRAQARARMRLRLLEGAPEGFEPVLVEVTANGIVIGTLDEEGVPVAGEPVIKPMAQRTLATELGGRDVKTTLVLFIVQPGGIALFDELRSMVAGAVAIGWQLWDPSGGSFFETPEKLTSPVPAAPTEGAKP